jgi:hypothetical protein
MSLLRPFAYLLKQLLHGRGGSKSYVLSTGIRGERRNSFDLSRQPDGTDIAKGVALGYRCDSIANPETRRLFLNAAVFPHESTGF